MKYNRVFGDRKNAIAEEKEKQVYENGFNHGFTVAFNLMCKYAREQQRKVQNEEYLK